MSTAAATWINAVLDLVRVSWQIQLGLFCTALIVVVLPAAWTEWIGVAKLMSSLRPICFVTTMLTSVMLIINGADRLVGHLTTERNFMGVLRNLSADERQVLRGYLESDSKTQYLDIRDGVAGGLLAAGVIYRSTNVATPNSFAFGYNIQPWAWGRLKKYPQLLE